MTTTTALRGGPSFATTRFSALPLDVLEKILGEHMDGNVAGVAAATSSCRATAFCGAPALARLGRALRLGRAALRSHRATLLLRRGLVGGVVSADELSAVDEEEAEDEAEAVAMLLVVGSADGAGGNSNPGRDDARRLRRERRRAAAERLRLSSEAALAGAVALARGAPPASVPLPPPAPPLGPSSRQIGARIAALVSLSPDPAVDLLAAARHASSRARDHSPVAAAQPQTPLIGGPAGAAAAAAAAAGLALLAAKRAAITASVQAELDAFIGACTDRQRQEQLRVQGEEQEDDDEEPAMTMMVGGGGGGGASGGLSSSSSSDDDSDDDDVFGSSGSSSSSSGSSSGSVRRPTTPTARAKRMRTATAAATADACVQTTGGAHTFGPSLEAVRLLTRDVAALAEKSTPETLVLLEHCLLTELRGWEGLPTPLP